jgi:hypothetical protein
MAARVLTATARLMDAVDPGVWAVHPTITAPIDGGSHAHMFHTDQLRRDRG